MREVRAPRGDEWQDIVDTLHGLQNVISVRHQYPAGHPAIERADQATAGNFTRLLSTVPEIVVALIDGEFVVSERPLPNLRERVPNLADAMVRHEIECMVFQPGVTAQECAMLGEILGTARDGAAPGRAREAAASALSHVLIRYADIKTNDNIHGSDAAAEFLVPRVRVLLTQVYGALKSGLAVDQDAVRALAREIVSRCRMRAFSLVQRSYTAGAEDEAGHATNVACITASLALEAELSEDECVEATAGALIHDVGRLLLPRALIGLPEPLLDEASRAVFRQHPLLGASALLLAGCPPLWVAAALEHHRGVDGRGYPPLASEEAPPLPVRLVALANFVDDKLNLLPGRFTTTDLVLLEAEKLEGRYFEPGSVRSFVRALGAFPAGTTVELSNHQSALVVRANPNDPLRPEIVLLSGANAGKRLDLKTINAIERRYEVSIVRAIPPPLSTRFAAGASPTATDEVPAPPPAAVPVPLAAAASAPVVPPHAAGPSLFAGKPSTSAMAAVVVEAAVAIQPVITGVDDRAAPPPSPRPPSSPRPERPASRRPDPRSDDAGETLDVTPRSVPPRFSEVPSSGYRRRSSTEIRAVRSQRPDPRSEDTDEAQMPPPRSQVPPRTTSSSRMPPVQPPSIPPRAPSMSPRAPSMSPPARPSLTPSRLPDRLSAMETAEIDGDLAGALAMAQGVLAVDPCHERARACASRCRAELGLSPLPPLQIPSLRVHVEVALASAQLAAARLDPVAAAVVSLIQQTDSLADVLAASGVSEAQLLSLLNGLADRGIVRVRSS